MRRANALVGGWMRAAGMSVREDGAGNLVGRLAPGRKGARTLLAGSHLDTVRDAGRFDGVLGVLLPIAALEVLRSRGARLPYGVEVLGFSEEEGVRFASAYLGSKAYAGTLGRRELGLRDADGVSVAEAISRALGRPFGRPGPAHRRGDLLGYLEAHIEQGPVLEARGLAAGVVSAIAGQTRARVVFTGRAGHAGTTPMRMRRDALAGAAQFALAAEALARRSPPLVATVGRITASPGAANVIAARAEATLDVRHPADSARLAALRALRSEARAIAARRGLGVSFEVTQDNAAVACSAGLTRALARSVRSVLGSCPALPSGAGHDAVIISRIAPVAMLFVRCRGGLSHSPAEFVQRRDLGAAIRIVVDFLGRMAARGGP
jgi:allantoate deiminase